MQLENRIRIKALFFGIVLVAVEIAIAGTLSWWQEQADISDATFIDAVGAIAKVALPHALKLRGELPGLLADML